MYLVQSLLFMVMSLRISNVRAEIPRTWEQVPLGRSHSCALLEGNMIKYWGDNIYGLLGIDSTQTQMLPQNVI